MKRYFIYFIQHSIVVYRVIALLTVTVSLGFAVQSCSGDIFKGTDPENDTVSQTKGEELISWEEQLEKIISDPLNIMINSGIELLGYEIISSNVDNSIDEYRYKEAIKADENMIPLYSEDLKSVTAITKKEATLKSSPQQAFNFEACKEFIDNIKLDGAKILKLKWNNNGIETNTICAVSDKSGIIYDNFISNTFMVKKPEESYVQIQGKHDSIAINKILRLKSGSEIDFTGSLIWELTSTATWLWGSKRGQVVITHTGYYTNGYFYYHDFSGTHYMSIGNSDVQVTPISYNTITYGYGMSTPLISISITLKGSSYEVNFSGSIGSTAGGEGQHSHPA